MRNYLFSLLRCLFLYKQFGWQCLPMYRTECNFQPNDMSRFSSRQTLPVSLSLFSCLSNEWIKIKDVLISTIQDFQVKAEEKSRQNAVAKFLLVIQNYQERK